MMKSFFSLSLSFFLLYCTFEVSHFPSTSWFASVEKTAAALYFATGVALYDSIEGRVNFPAPFDSDEDDDEVIVAAAVVVEAADGTEVEGAPAVDTDDAADDAAVGLDGVETAPNASEEPAGWVWEDAPWSPLLR